MQFYQLALFMLLLNLSMSVISGLNMFNVITTQEGYCIKDGKMQYDLAECKDVWAAAATVSKEDTETSTPGGLTDWFLQYLPFGDFWSGLTKLGDALTMAPTYAVRIMQEIGCYGYTHSSTGEPTTDPCDSTWLNFTYSIQAVMWFVYLIGFLQFMANRSMKSME